MSLAREQQIPVDPRKPSLPQWLMCALLEQRERAQRRQREAARQRLGLVVEVDEHRLAVPGLDEAVGVAVEGGLELAPRTKRCTLSMSTSLWKCATEPAFDVGRSVASPSTNMLAKARALQRVAVGGHEGQLVAEAGAPDEVGASVRRDGDEQVEADLAAVVAGQRAEGAVDGGRVEVGDHLDAAPGQQIAQRLGRLGLGEGAVERRDQHQLDPVAHPALGEVGVGQERELERRHGALDGHLGDVDDEPAPVEALERAGQRGGAVERVEVEGGLAPARAGEAGQLLGGDARAGGDDEHVVVERAAVLEEHAVGGGVDAVERRDDELGLGRQDRPAGAHQLARRGLAEGHEEQPRLVDVVVVLVDHRHAPLGGVQRADEAVGHGGPTGAGAEDDEAFHAGASVSVLPSRIATADPVRSS
jgi:hypothetical protein